MARLLAWICPVCGKESPYFLIPGCKDEVEKGHARYFTEHSNLDRNERESWVEEARELLMRGAESDE